MQPQQLVEKLSAIRSRVKMLAVATGGGFVIATAMACLVVVVLLDFLLNLPTSARFVFLIAALVTIVYVAVRYMIKPAMAKLTVGDIAGRVENAFPQFDDRLRSTVNFLSNPVPGSDVMKEKVAGETARLAETVDLNQVVVAKPMWHSAGIAGGAVLVVMALALLIGDQYRSIALSRLSLAATPWPKSVQITLQSDPPLRVTAGQRFDIKMKLTKGDKSSRKAKLVYQYPGQKPVEELMTRGEDGVYSSFHDAKLEGDATSGSVKMWIVAGDDDTPPIDIQIVPKLAIARVEADITPPPYARSAGTTVNLRESPAVMAAGAQVLMRVSFNKPLSNKAIELESVKPDIKLPQLNIQRDGDRTALIRFSPRESAEIRVKATDIDDFTNESNESYVFTIRPDQNPTVLFENPRGNEQRTPIATVPLQAVAEDDYGIKTVTLNVERLGDKRKWEIPLVASSAAMETVSWLKIDGSGDLQRQRLNYQWDLSKLPNVTLQPGDVLEYSLAVTDNFELDGKTHPPVHSGRLRITIISDEELKKIAQEEMQKASRQVLDIKRSQDNAKVKTQHELESTQNKDTLDDAQKNALETIANQQSTAASQTNQVANKLDQLIKRLDENKSSAQDLKNTARDVANQLKRTAEGPQKDAADKINQAKDNPTPKEQRNESLTDAIAKQQEASNRLDNALEKLGRTGTLEKIMSDIRDILKEQETISRETADIGRTNLGKQPKDMKPEDQKRLAKNAEAQRKLAERTQKTLNEMRDTAQQMSKSDLATSQAMQDAAKTGEQQQVAANQSKASQAASKNQQSQAQSAQKQAEIGLQMMLTALAEAERRKLEQLNEELAKLKDQIETLIRRQAGHNLDDLTLQGPERMAKVDAKTLTELLTYSRRDKNPVAQPPTVLQLTQAQELTERNTRSIAAAAEEVEKGGAEIAAHLSRANTEMQAAIVWLRQGKLNDAYDPPQVKALYSLVQALNKLDEVQKEVEKDLEDKKKDSIRAALTKIRDDQLETVNKVTQAIDKERNPDKSYKREAAATLNGLPGTQGKLADPRMKELQADIESLGGIVYVWAAKEVVASMNTSKELLAKPETGAVVQIEQAKIIEQLDAMIESLKTEPKQQEFDAKGGGNGSGSGGPPPPTLPTEAELRLLRALQLAVNNATIKLAAQPDKARISETGVRQGELRDLLAQLTEKASRGAIKIGPEPDSRNQLPADATEADLEAAELEDELAVGQPPPEKGGQLIKAATRMARSRQRLAINNDPGKVTQMIQKKIIIDLEQLIDQARQQQANSQQQQQQQKPGEQMNQGDAQAQAQNQGKPRPGQPQQGGSEPAEQSNLSGGGSHETSGRDIRETLRDWGGVTQREREAILEAQGEKIVEKYRKYLEDYYKAQATRATEGK